MIRVFYGSSVQHLSHYRKILQSVSDDCQQAVNGIIQPVYLINLTRQISEAETTRLKAYLENGPVSEQPQTASDNTASGENHFQTRYVIPRLGTTSPWSSKATDIAHQCHLDFIEKIEHGLCWQFENIGEDTLAKAEALIHDPLTETILTDAQNLDVVFAPAQPGPLVVVDVLNYGMDALNEIDARLQLALTEDEKEYLCQSYLALNKNPTDAELMMFSQVNSEHCRHKIFNASWTIDSEDKDKSLFAMIRNTHQTNPQGTLVAYKDNASVIRGNETTRYMIDRDYRFTRSHEPVHILTKVETHNHPTAISPFPGAATGSGGEIRDEGATGRGSKPKAGLTGYSVSNLRIPGHIHEWEMEEDKPGNICSPLKIMLDAPIGGASFNNEFGRPNLCGYFRTFEQQADFGEAETAQVRWGYHKPIMIAGGLGNIREQHVEKGQIPPGAKLVVLGGPAMLIGLGGGAASSVGSGQGNEDLDFASVQRGNPEMQRRCQEVIDACWSMGADNPIVSIHDVGAGGLSNALPEIIHDASLGGKIELRKILNQDIGMSPMEIWCNEAQERYVLAIEGKDIERFEAICQRERCLYCIVGEATTEENLLLNDALLNTDKTLREPVDLPMGLLFGKPPKMHRIAEHAEFNRDSGFTESQHHDAGFINDALNRVLRLPSVGDKTFLITIGDRSVTGLVARDQMTGPWQVPVADVAVTLAGYEDNFGEAMAMGERTPLAVHNGPASARMAVAEAITNISAASIENISDIKLSANWMAAAGQKGQDASLFDTVQAVGMQFCPQIGVSIPVGKDSMSMRCQWQDDAAVSKTVLSPVSLVISAFSPVSDVNQTLTPQLKDAPDHVLLLIDIGNGKNRLGGSALEQVYNKNSGVCADIDQPEQLTNFFRFIQSAKKHITAYHDRSDGGLMVTLLEMAFASRTGLDINLSAAGGNSPLAMLFSEEAGAVIQVSKAEVFAVMDLAEKSGISDIITEIGHAVAKSSDNDETINIRCNGKTVVSEKRSQLQELWSLNSWQMQRMRDNPQCADEEYQRISDDNDKGIFSELRFDLKSVNDYVRKTAMINTGAKPKVAILREQGTNGHFEMANAFELAGFESFDVHMSDLFEGRQQLSQFNGLAACGGFSYGDVLGAGRGWANAILFNENLNKMFADFLGNSEKFALGVCNGCQMLALLKDIVPGAADWPVFEKNFSEQYEARQIMVKVRDSRSIFFKDMADSVIPLVIGHGEGRAVFSEQNKQINDSNVTLQFVGSDGQPAQKYPANPNGSPNGITGLTNEDGRVSIMMPHPERVIRTVNHSYRPDDWKENQYSPWLKIFQNAYQWLA